MTRLHSMSLLPLLLVLTAGPASAAERTMAPEVKALVDRMQGFYERTQAFTADFKQEYHYKTFNRTVVSTGTVAFQKPAKMRWEYLTPSKRSFVLSGERIYALDPEAQTLTKAALPTSQLSASVTFLWGKGEALRRVRHLADGVQGMPGHVAHAGPEEAGRALPRGSAGHRSEVRAGAPQHRHRPGRKPERHRLLESQDQRGPAEGDLPAHAAPGDQNHRHHHPRHRTLRAAPFAVVLVLAACAHGGGAGSVGPTVKLALRSGPGSPSRAPSAELRRTFVWPSRSPGPWSP